MFPVLFSIGRISVSSYGFFLALGIFFGIFLVWRLSRAWDLDEEKILDLTVLTFLGGLLGARAFFVIRHLTDFAAAPVNIILINKVPGLSFWGGFLAGWLILYFFARKFRIDFWQVADIAAVGLIGGVLFSDIGCFLGSCNIGVPSKAFFAVTMAGSIGRRWPVQVFEAMLLLAGLIKIWSQATHFHQRGKIAGLALILIGIVRFILAPLQQNQAVFSAVICLILGVIILYRVTKQNPLIQFRKIRKFIIKFVIDPETRKQVIQILSRSWYNQKTNIIWRLRNLKKLLRRSNVKFS